MGSARNMTQQKDRDNTEQEKRLATFTAFSAMLSQSLEIRQVIKTAIDMVLEIMRAEAALIFFLDEETEELRVIAFEGVSKEFASAVDRIKVGEGFYGQAAQTGKPLIIEDTSTDPKLTVPAVKNEKLRAQLIMPLTSRGKIIGTLCVATRSPRRFDNTEIELLTALSNQIGIAMENSRLYQEQITTAEQLRLSEEKYRQLFESAHDAIWVQDLSGKIIAANNACARLVGYPLTELIGKDAREFLHQEGLNLAREIREKLLHGEAIEQPYEQKLTRRDGIVITLMLTTNLLTSRGQPIGFQHIARDITVERRMQENLRFYVQQITRAQEDERQRIARELHDSTAQNLIAIIHRLESYCQERTQLPGDDSKLLLNFQEQLKDILQEIRQFSRDLRPSILDDLGLLPAVEWLTEELKSGNGIEANLTITGPERRFSPETEVTLFRIIQEALRNITKHAEATKVDVNIGFKDSVTTVIINDNGKGFQPPRSISELPRLGKLGLAGLEERVRLLGGDLNIQSELNKGTTLSITIPAETP